jgi:hypothetical protein
MPTVVTFWRLPEEETPFLDYLENSGAVLGVATQKNPSRDALKALPLREAFQDDPSVVLLLLAEHRDLLHIVPFQQDGAIWYGVHAMKSPVIDYARGKWRGTSRLGQSNAAFYSDYPDESGKRMIAHPAEYVDWAKGVAKWLRKSTPFFHQYKNYRITKMVEERVKNGLELVP